MSFKISSYASLDWITILPHRKPSRTWLSTYLILFSNTSLSYCSPFIAVYRFKTISLLFLNRSTILSQATWTFDVIRVLYLAFDNSFANAKINSVFPVPGGPWINMKSIWWRSICITLSMAVSCSGLFFRIGYSVLSWDMYASFST